MKNIFDGTTDFKRRSWAKAGSVFIFFIILGAGISQSYAATYYVDYINGRDSYNGTTIATPWQHVPGDSAAVGNPAGTTLDPGDTVIFKGGVVYSGQTNVDGVVAVVPVKWSGTEGNPITYDGNSAGSFGTGKAVIDGLGDSLGVNASQDGVYAPAQSGIGKSYIVVNNFEIRNMRYIYEDNSGYQPMGVYFSGGATNVEIKNCYIHSIKPASVPLNIAIANPVNFLSTVSIANAQTLTDTAANFSSPINYATTAGQQAVYKVWLAWNPTDYYSAWGYIGPLNGNNNALKVYQDIDLQTPGWNISNSSNSTPTVTGTTATSANGVLTDTGANFTGAGNVVDNVDFLVITSGTGVAPGYYLITSHTNTTVTVLGYTGTPLGTSTAGNIHYSVNQAYYSPVNTGVSGNSASSVGSVLTDTGANFKLPGIVTAGVDYLRITGGVGATPGDYPITAVNSANSLTVTGTLGTASGISYTIVKHYFYWIYSLAGGAAYANGGYGVEITGYSNVSIHNNTVQDARWAIAANCSWSVACNNISIYNNDISRTAIGIQGSPGQGVGENYTNVNIYNNQIHDFAAWNLYDWVYHRDAIYVWGNSAGTTAVTGVNIYNNDLYGNIGVDDVTAQLYLEYYMKNINIYNNVFSMTAPTGGYSLEIVGTSSLSPTITNVGVYNNTFAKVPGDEMHSVRFAELGNVTMENNIFYLFDLYGSDFSVDQSTASSAFAGYCITNGCNSSGFDSDYNLLTSANTYGDDLGYGTYQSTGNVTTNLIYSLSAWKSLNSTAFSSNSNNSLLQFPTLHDQDSTIITNPNPDPEFTSFPLFAAQVASTGTSSLINLTPNTNTNYDHVFSVNDHVEYNGDGVVRQVTAVNGSTITITPALPQNSQAEDEVVDWGASSNFTINAALKSGSPGIGSGTNLSSIIGNTDIAGISRPATGSWDIGAYQSVYSLNVNVAGNGQVFGSTTASPDFINCGVNPEPPENICSANVGRGMSVILIASPATGSTFSGWSGGCSGTGSCTVTMNAAQNVTATFRSGPVNGSCGAAAQTYLYNATSFGSNALCRTGNPNPSIVAFPVPGGIFHWSCVGINNGLNSTCSAKRNNRAIIKLL